MNVVNSLLRPVEHRPSTSRLRQGLDALRPSLSSRQRTVIESALTDAQAALVHELPEFDQAHLCRVYERLRASGESDVDVLTAALLHDVGKVQNGYAVKLPHRVARVILERLAPGVLAWLARIPASRWRHGFVLAVHHPVFGAEKAAAANCSARVCWLIAHHEDDPPPDDEGLRRLMVADNAS
jgi:hypothetical protein